MSETYFDKKYLPPDLKTSNQGDRERNNQNLMPNSKMDSGPLLLNNFLPSENNDSIEQDKQKDKVGSLAANTRDVHYLMEKYKSENNGVGTTDICLLFSFWQTNFGSELTHPKGYNDGTNYNSKSFNNQTYFPNERAQPRGISIEASPIVPGSKYDNFDQNSLENNVIVKDKDLDSLDFEYNSQVQRNTDKVPKIQFHPGEHNKNDRNALMQNMQFSQISNISHQPKNAKASHVDSMLYSQKIKSENSHEIKLGNVKNQMLSNNKRTNGGQMSINNMSSLSQIDDENMGRDQLSVDFMNITPIMEEKEFRPEEQQKVEPQRQSTKEQNMDEQFSFDKGYNFDENQDDDKDKSDMMDMDEKDLVNDLEQMEQRFSLDKPSTLKKKQCGAIFDYNYASNTSKEFSHSQYKSTGAESQAFIPNIFRYHQGATSLSREHLTQSMVKFNQNLVTMRSSHRYYQNMVEAQKSVFMVLNNRRFINFANNLSFLNDFQVTEMPERKQSLDIQSPRKLSQLIEMSGVSPILDKKSYRDPTINKARQVSMLRRILEKTMIGSSKKLVRFTCCLRHRLVLWQQWFQNYMYDWSSMEDVNVRMLTQYVDEKIISEIQEHHFQNCGLNQVMQIPKAFADHLSSIDSGDNADDVDEGEVLEALQAPQESNEQKTREHMKRIENQNEARKQQLKNDDAEYKRREMKNLSKQYRDKSAISNKSDMATFKAIRNEMGDTDVFSNKDKSSKKRRHRHKDRSTKRDDQKSSHKKRRGKSTKHHRDHSAQGQKSQKSKSKSRFSNNLGFTQLQNAIDNDEDALENTSDIEKLLQEIDNDQNELANMISKEEEDFNKKFENKLNDAEREIQNSRREGSHIRGQDSGRQHYQYNNQGIYGPYEQTGTSKGIADNFQLNQHHNGISNNSNSFYFNMSKRLNEKVGSNNESLSNNPYNPGSNGGNREARIGSGNHSPSSSSSSSNTSSLDGRAQPRQDNNRNVSQQVYTQSSQLLTDRPNICKKLEIGKVRNNLQNRVGAHAVGQEKSNERQVSVVSGNSIGGFNQSNRQRFLFSNNNNLSAINNTNQQQYSSLSRMGIKKISSGYSGNNSNASPANKNLMSSQKFGMFRDKSNQQNRSSGSGQNNFQSTQKSYRTLNPLQSQNQGQSNILQKLQSNQMAKVHGQTSTNSMMLNLQTTDALSHRGGTSIQSIITPKSLKGYSMANQLQSKTNTNVKQPPTNGIEQPELRQINLQQSGSSKKRKDQEVSTTENREVEHQNFNHLESKTIENDKPAVDRITFQDPGFAVESKPKQSKNVLTIKMQKVTGQGTGALSSRPILQSQNLIRLKSNNSKNRGTDPGFPNTNLTSLNQSNEKNRNASNSSSACSRTKLKLKFKTNTHKTMAVEKTKGPLMINRVLETKEAIKPEMRRDRNSRNVKQNTGQVAQQLTQTQMKKMPNLQLSPRNMKEKQFFGGENEQRESMHSMASQSKTDRLGDTGKIQRPSNTSALYANQPVQKQSSVQKPQKDVNAQSKLKQPTLNLGVSVTKQKALNAHKKATVNPHSQSQSNRSSNIALGASTVPKKSFGLNSMQKTNQKVNQTMKTPYENDQSQLSQQELIQQSYFASGPGELLNEAAMSEQDIADSNRLMKLLVDELKRKKGKNIVKDYEPQDQVPVLVSFWKESLIKGKILNKLKIKQQQSFIQQNNGYSQMTNTSSATQSKLSDKERYLLAYLEGTDTSQLLGLHKESTTRNYGELATMSEDALITNLIRYLNLSHLKRPSTQYGSSVPQGQYNTTQTMMTQSHQQSHTGILQQTGQHLNRQTRNHYMENTNQSIEQSGPSQ